MLNYYMATGVGREVARLLHDYAEWKDVRDYQAYERDLVDFVSRVAGKPVEELQITALIGEIFNIMRRHRIRAAATFTVVNIALMVAEGLGRKLDPSLNPSLEARPWLESALGLGAAPTAP
jgi:predicted unusual protein kinase regulating ubiquinone biosynthesis (AarF/ABC1/UbiB family)